jgi:tetratricopeptide (TPR) repeat protein
MLSRFSKNHPDEPEFTEAIHSLEGLLNNIDGTAHAGRKLVEQGEHLFRQGKVDEAIGSFKEALEIDPDLAVAHNNLAIAYHDKGELENAIQALMSAMRLAPDDPDVIWNCGQVLIELGYLKDALKVYKDFLEKNPDDLGFIGGVRDLVDSLNRDNLVAVNSKAERTPIVSVASHP